MNNKKYISYDYLLNNWQDLCNTCRYIVCEDDSSLREFIRLLSYLGFEWRDGSGVRYGNIFRVNQYVQLHTSITNRRFLTYASTASNDEKIYFECTQINLTQEDIDLFDKVILGV